MKRKKDNVIYVDFRRNQEDQILDYYRHLDGKVVEFAYSESHGHFIVGVIDPRKNDFIIIDCGLVSDFTI